MRLLVTGGCGFIGTNFIRRVLSRESDVHIVNLDALTYAGNPLNLRDLEEAGANYTFVRGDICDAELVSDVLARHHIDAVVNFAAESHVDRSIHDAAPFLQTNIIGAQVMLECARKAGITQYVHVSTDEVYGSLGPEGAFTEATPLAPNSPYSASKASADLLCRAWFETHDFPVIITRCSNNYGPYQFPEKLIPLMYTRACVRDALPVYGSGENVRDWIWVDDHCEGVWLALTKGNPGEAYNFGGAAERTNLEVVRAICAACGCGEELITFVKDRPGHDLRYAMNYSKAERELGFSPTLSFEQGLAQTIEWYRANPEWVESVTSGAYREFMRQWYEAEGRA